MPGLWAHSFFFSSKGGVAPPKIDLGWYPAWQGAAILGSLWGPLQEWWETWLAVRRVYHLLRGLDAERRFVVERTAQLLREPTYEAARQAVRGTATTRGLREGAMWVWISRRCHERPHWTENIYRRIHASMSASDDLTRRTVTCTAWEREFLIEAAYLALRERG